MLSSLENDLSCICKHAYYGQTSRNIFRLAAILCMLLVINPGQYLKRQSLSVDEDGVNIGIVDNIGGGFLAEDVFMKAEAGIALTPASHVLDGDTLNSNVIYNSIVFNDESNTLETVSKSRILIYSSHVVQSGDNISSLAFNFGLNQDTIISVNKITSTRLLQIGRVLNIPNQDGILHTVRAGENLSSIAERYRVEQESIKVVNELFSDKVVTGTELFIPGARLDRTRLQEINGDLFIWPVRGVVTSGYGWRRDPFNRNRRQFHNGIDIRGNTGTPVRAAMAGRVSRVGWDNVYGNYVIINHHSGYRTLYAHLNVIRTRSGAQVSQGERIGDVGSTGLSTGPHLHFTIYRNGVTVNPRALMR